MMTREDRFTDLVMRVGFLSREDFENVRRAHRSAAEQGYDRPLVDFMVERQFIKMDQVRMLNLTLRHDEARAEDKALAEYLRKRSLVPAEAIEECYENYDKTYKEGRPFPRLHELLVRRGYMTSDHARRILAERSRANMPDRRSELLDTRRFTMPSTPSSDRLATKVARDGALSDLLRVARRRVKFPDTTGSGKEVIVHIIGVQGVLDGHTYASFDKYLVALLDAGAMKLVLVCAKLEYVSSAGLGVLASAARRCKEGGGEMVIAAIPKNVHKVFDMLGLQKLVRVVETERAGILAFKP